MLAATSKPNGDRQPDAWLAAQFLEVTISMAAQTAYGMANDNGNANLRPELERAAAAMAALQQRGAGGETGLLAGLRLFEFAGLRQAARDGARGQLARFPGSAALHELWRNRMLIDLGTAAMLDAYRAWSPTAEPAVGAWFHGYAALVAGDQWTREQKPARATAAYGEAVDQLTRSGAANADFADSANHFTVLALAGRASLALDQPDLAKLQAAAGDLLRAHALRPASLDDSDGLERKPRAIAGRVERALRSKGEAALADRLLPLLP
jgi:hypothetical protein